MGNNSVAEFAGFFQIFQTNLGFLLHKTVSK